MSSSSTTTKVWANLQPEMVLSIAERLVVADIIRIRVVCRSWACALGKRSNKCPVHHSLPSSNLSFCRTSPWLLLSNSAGQSDRTCTFFSIIEDRSYRIHSLPQTTGRQLLESPHPGWFVTIDLQFIPRFLNPFTGQELTLPSMLTIPKSDNTPDSCIEVLINTYLKKIVFTPYPQRGGIAVAVWDGGFNRITLPFARVGNKSWHVGPNLPLTCRCLRDVVYNEKDQKLYALSSCLDVFILEFTEHSLEIVFMVAGPVERPPIFNVNAYIFFSHGDLMLVNWYSSRHYETFNGVNYQASLEFKIFRFDMDLYRLRKQQNSCWVSVNELGNQSLILGTNTCFSFSWDNEQKNNKVFFIGNMTKLLKDDHIFRLGMFDLESQVVGHSAPYDNIPGRPFPILFMPAPKLWD